MTFGLRTRLPGNLTSTPSIFRKKKPFNALRSISTSPSLSVRSNENSDHVSTSRRNAVIDDFWGDFQNNQLLTSKSSTPAQDSEDHSRSIAAADDQQSMLDTPASQNGVSQTTTSPAGPDSPDSDSECLSDLALGINLSFYVGGQTDLQVQHS